MFLLRDSLCKVNDSIHRNAMPISYMNINALHSFKSAHEKKLSEQLCVHYVDQ